MPKVNRALKHEGENAMKKTICLVVALVTVAGAMFLTTSCAKTEKLICGVTEYEPMNFREDGKWTGFDTEFAKLVGNKIGMEVEFQEIVWEQKYSELEAGSISCIWNGFTANALEDGVPRTNIVDMSYSYMLNQQCVVVKASRTGEFTSLGDLADKTAAAEKGSAGEAFAKDVIGDNGKLIESSAQINTFIEVKSGAVDYAVVDILLGQRVAGSGDYSDLAVANITLDSEVYAIGFKKGDALRQKVNDAIKALYDAGTLMELATKYGLENQLTLDTAFGK